MVYLEAAKVKAGDILVYHTEDEQGRRKASIKVRVRVVYRFAGIVRINAVPVDENNKLGITGCDAPHNMFDFIEN